MYFSPNTNLMAANTARNLNTHYAKLAISVQRLSSGLRINSAADDAAGLAIRELMRADVAAMQQGARNANDAISLLQTADGALGVIDEKLIRMKELAEQAATGTYNSTQRLMIDSEYQVMAREITRIANATDFNGVHLLNGTLAGEHDGSGLASTGKLKIHFGSGNDSAEDYYYIEIGNCTAEALGVGNQATKPFFSNVKHEQLITEHKTFTPATSYDEYTDPVTNIKYYSDGKYFFLNPADPANTALDWVKDGEIISRLETEPVVTTSNSRYYIYQHPGTGKNYYTQNHITYFSNPDDPDGEELSRYDQDDWQIISQLKDLDSTVRINTKWQVYEDSDGALYYTCDGGLTFSPDKDNPAEGILDSHNREDFDKIRELKPKVQEKYVEGPSQDYVYLEYRDGNGKIYYVVAQPDSEKGAIVENPSRPEETRWDGSLDDLTPVSAMEPTYGDYTLYRLPGSNVNYYEKDGKYYTSTGPATNPLVEVTNDPNIPGNLRKIPEVKTTTSETYTVYKDKAGNTVYGFDNDTKFVVGATPPGKPENIKTKDEVANLGLEPVGVTMAGSVKFTLYENKDNPTQKFYTNGDGNYYTFPGDSQPVKDVPINSLVETNTTVVLDTTYTQYYDKNNPDKSYFSYDDGRTFYEKDASGAMTLANGITKNNVNKSVKTTTFSQRTYVYVDPDTRNEYTADNANFNGPFTAADGTVLDNPDAISRLQGISNPRRVQDGAYYKYYNADLDAPYPTPGTIYYSKSPNGGPYLDKPGGTEINNPAITGNLELLPESVAVKVTLPYPDAYNIYIDPESGLKYYKDESTGKIISQPGNPYDPDNPNNELVDDDIKNRLVPFEAVVKVTSYEDKLVSGAYTVSTQEAAQNAIEAINDAIVAKDKIRAHLGASLNRLENTIANLNIQAENLMAAESRISDTDFSTEMTDFVRNQILTQSATAMLAQANSMPQMCMQLFQG